MRAKSVFALSLLLLAGAVTAYNDAGQKWSWANSNYMFGTFDVTSEDFEKFNAFTMQEMEKSKAEKKKS